MQPETFPALVAAGARHAIQGVCFWAAVVLPVLYLSAAAASVKAELVAGLIVAHAVALLVGHRHRPQSGETQTPRPGAPDTD